MATRRSRYALGAWKAVFLLVVAVGLVATGVRMTALPMTPDRVLMALIAAGREVPR